MMQQVNLYQSVFQTPKDLFAAKNILLAIAATFALLLVVYGLAFWDLSSEEERLAKVNQQLDSVKKQLEEVRSLNPDEATAIDLEATVSSLVEEKRVKSHLLHALQAKGAHNRDGFSEYLVALSRQVEEGVWLERIKFARGGQEISLFGRTLDARAIFRLFQKLGQEAPYSGREFNTVTIGEREVEDEAPMVGLPFLLSTIQPDPLSLEGEDGESGTVGLSPELVTQIFGLTVQ